MQDHQERADARPVQDHAMPRRNRRKDAAMQDHANVRRKGRGSVVQGWQRHKTRLQRQGVAAHGCGATSGRESPRGKGELQREPDVR